VRYRHKPASASITCRGASTTAGNGGEAVSKTVHKTAFSRLTSLGNNWQLKSLLVRFRSNQCQVANMHFVSAGVENMRFTEETAGLSKLPRNGLANRRFRPLSHPSTSTYVS
jgi:hypothetical protein